MEQVVKGTGEELIAFLERYRDEKKLTLIISREEAGGESRSAYPDGAVIRNGVPLLPTQNRAQPVTMEHVKQLMDEEN